MKVMLGLGVLFAVAMSVGQPSAEAPAGFDDKSNGMVDETTHQADRVVFDEVEGVENGLGPLYNAQSCRECHQDPTSGGASQVTELRVGHRGPDGKFRNPEIPIARGTEIITGRTLVNDRAICPSGAFPDTEIHERVPEVDKIRTTRISLSVLGDGFVEAVADQTLLDLAREQCRRSHGRICGQAIRVPILEAPGETGIGRFGWKDQHASLQSFSADAYLNEMGVTSRLIPDEVTKLCNTAPEPNSPPGPDGLDDVDRFARFIRATKAPARDKVLAETLKAKRGSAVFDRIGCASCHVRTLTTATAGTKTNGGTYTVPEALAGKAFSPFGDFLLHNVGTGDGIVIPVEEHYGRRAMRMVQGAAMKNFSMKSLHDSQNKVRTPPLWGVRLRTRLMHDGAAVTLSDAIERHRGEAAAEQRRFKALSPAERQALLEFLRSL
jgi:CxxC motif-containing protein (DUF1111 family)